MGKRVIDAREAVQESYDAHAERVAKQSVSVAEMTEEQVVQFVEELAAIDEFYSVVETSTAPRFPPQFRPRDWDSISGQWPMETIRVFSLNVIREPSGTVRVHRPDGGGIDSSDMEILEQVAEKVTNKRG